MNVTYPLELMARARSKKGSLITLSYLFEVYNREDNDFLVSLGFSNGNLRGLKPFNSTKIATVVKTDITLGPLVEGKHGHFLYEGKSITGDCEPSLYFVSQELSWMSQNQLYELNSSSSKIKETIQRAVGLTVYQNIDQNLDSFPLNISGPLTRPKFPTTFQYAQFMYAPGDGDQVGLIEPQYLPGWLRHNVTIYTPAMPALPDGIKYLPFYYQLAEDGRYFTVYVVVPESYSYTINIQPASIPIVIRSNIPHPVSNIRPLVHLEMGVIRIDPELIAQLQNKALKEEMQEKMRLLQEKKDNITQMNAKIANQVPPGNTQTSQSELDSIVKTEADRKLRNEDEERRMRAVRWEKRCVTWKLVSIINRYFGNDDAWDLKGVWKGGNSGLYTCIEWKDVRVGEFGQEVDGKGNPKASPNTTSQVNPTKPPPGQLLGNLTASPTVTLNRNKCSHYLAVILNKNWKDSEFKDLVVKQCNGAQPDPTTIKNLAMVGMTELLGKTTGESIESTVSHKSAYESFQRLSDIKGLAKEEALSFGKDIEKSLLSPLAMV